MRVRVRVRVPRLHGATKAVRSAGLGGGLAREPEEVAGRPVARIFPAGVHAAQSHQARPEEAQGGELGRCQRGALTTLL